MDGVFGKIQLRDPNKVMRLSRLGSSHQNRLSFMRTLLRRLKKENWQFTKSHFQLDENGFGCAVYQASGPFNTYSLVCFSHRLDDKDRTDRVIANAWDATFVLFDGVPTNSDIDRLSKNVPKQEGGRVSSKELTLSRANRSLGLWDYVLDRLAKGQQPSLDKIIKAGYLLRTTAVYGSGKFGAKDRLATQSSRGLSGCFQVEMLSVYLIRTFSIDLIEHIAKKRGGKKAVRLNTEIKRRLGVGNSTGLGMAPFVRNHPALIHSWVYTREQAFMMVRQIISASNLEKSKFKNFIKRSQVGVDQWYSEHELQKIKIKNLQQDLKKILAFAKNGVLNKKFPWQLFYLWGEKNLTKEGQEKLLSLILEPYGNIVDKLTKNMSVDENSHFPIDGSFNVQSLIHILKIDYAWALDIDFDKPKNKHFVWYVSEEKLEPRVGLRYDCSGAENGLSSYEQSVSTVEWQVKELYEKLQNRNKNEKIDVFLSEHPEYRHIIRRVQIVNKNFYGEIRDSVVDESMLPIDILRFKLSFFGAIKYDPRSKLWVRVCLFQNAPLPEELQQMPIDDWIYPPHEDSLQ